MREAERQPSPDRSSFGDSIAIFMENPIKSRAPASLPLKSEGGATQVETGLSTMGAELTAKLLRLLKESIPRLASVAVLWNPGGPW